MADITNIFGGPFIPTEKKKADPPEVQFLQEIIDSGINPDLHGVVLDGNVHRFDTGGRKGKTGWYIGFADGIPSGRFGCWRQGIEQSWRATTDREISAVEHMALMHRMEEAKKRRDEDRARQQEIAADIVMEIWSQAPPASDDHPYLKSKGISAHGARITGDGRLIVPLYDAAGQLISLQYISHLGDKQYHGLAKTHGGFYAVGGLSDTGVLYIAEGFATAATVHEQTGRPCVAAFSASNLVHVAKAMRDRYPDRSIVIIADNDAHGVGREKAEQACALTGATYVMPPTVGMDANDWVQAGGSIEDIVGGVIKPADNWLEKVTTSWISQPAPIRWLIKGWMPEQCLGMLHGPSGAGKSFVLLDMVMHMASGKQWQSKPTKKGCVVYLAGEGNYGMRSRVAAWMQEHGVSDVDLFISKSGCNLNTPEGYAQAMGALQEVAKSYTILAVCVDTLHRFLHGDENSAQDAKTMIDACDAIKRSIKTSVWLVHHTGLGEGARDRARGSSAWRGALDVEIGLRAPEGDDTGVIIMHKMKDAELSNPMQFKLKRVPINNWFDEDGDQVYGAVVEWLCEAKEKKKVTPLDKCISAFGRAFVAVGDIEDGKARLSVDAWRDFIREDEPNLSESSIRIKTARGNSRGDRYLGHLEKHGKIVEVTPSIWEFVGDELAGHIAAKTIKSNKS